MKKDQVIALVVFAMLVIVASILVKSYGWTLVIDSLLVLLIIISLAWLIIKNIRFSRLLNKYGDEEIVRIIMGRALWQGQTAE